MVHCRDPLTGELGVNSYLCHLLTVGHWENRFTALALHFLI